MKGSPIDFLEILSGPEDGKCFEIPESGAVIGRLPENVICLPLDLSISRRHARLQPIPGGYRLELFSEARNAGMSGEERILPGSAATLKPGDIFKLGDVLFRLAKGASC